MTKLEMVQQALNELGDASPHDVADFINRTHGMFIEPAIIPIIRATLWSQELQEQFRREAKDVLAKARNVG